VTRLFAFEVHEKEFRLPADRTVAAHLVEQPVKRQAEPVGGLLAG
jgi:hypothetical protein